MSRALVPLAEGCEELEAVTVIDLLRRAGVEVVAAGLGEGPVTAARGTRLLPDATLDAALADGDYDLVALPGGLPGADHLLADARLAALLPAQLARGGRVAAICAAPKVLAAAGALDGRRATCYPGCVEEAAYPRAAFTGGAVEVDGPVVTSRGPGTATDFALALIEALEGRAKRDEVEAQLAREPAAA